MTAVKQLKKQEIRQKVIEVINQSLLSALKEIFKK